MKPLRVLVLNANAERRQGLATLFGGAGHEVAFADGTPGSVKLVGYDFLLLDPADPVINLNALRDQTSAGNNEVPASLDEVERLHLEAVLRHTSGNKRKAAHLLGISRSTLLNKVRKYGLERQ